MRGDTVKLTGKPNSKTNKPYLYNGTRYTADKVARILIFKHGDSVLESNDIYNVLASCSLRATCAKADLLQSLRKTLAKVERVLGLQELDY